MRSTILAETYGEKAVVFEKDIFCFNWKFATFNNHLTASSK